MGTDGILGYTITTTTNTSPYKEIVDYYAAVTNAYQKTYPTIPGFKFVGFHQLEDNMKCHLCFAPIAERTSYVAYTKNGNTSAKRSADEVVYRCGTKHVQFWCREHNRFGCCGKEDVIKGSDCI